MSDLHGELPDAHEVSEITLICGDIIPLRIQRNKPQSQKWFETEFMYWVKNWPSEKIYLIAGNHDFVFESYMPDDEYKLYTLSDNKLVYLNGRTSVLYQDNEGNIYKIFGTPFCHVFGNWAFMHSEEFLEGLYNQVPNNIDIWLTHDTPALEDLDLLPPSRWSQEPIHAGGQSLAKAIQRVKPKYVFCGHLHTCKDKYLKLNNTEIYNVSILDNDYHISYEPTYLEID